MRTSVTRAVTSGGRKLTFSQRAFSCFSSRQLHYDLWYPREIPYYVCGLAGLDKRIFASAHNETTQISAAGVKMNVEEVFEQWLDVEERVMNVIVVVRVRIRT